ncbi:hypothetical protein LBMAG57_30260 [Verrucomicrobiota bacterium]|jgi:hypothetical protein|nr:hypothetical protein LBMAG57_30260 [Verrucomicrobiota bacterium]
MKYFLLLGGFSGFVLGLAASLLAGNQPADVLFTGAACCVAGALLLRGLHFILMICLHAHIETLAAARKKENPAPSAEPSTRA